MNDLTDREQTIQAEWIRDAFTAAVHAGYVSAPWKPTAGDREMMHGYYASGLTPAEAAQALFATRH